MLKSACIILGIIRDQDCSKFIEDCDLIFADQTAETFIDNGNNIGKKLRKLSCSEISNNKRISLETVCNILAPFVDYSTSLIASNRQLAPQHVIKALAMPHIKSIFYEVNCQDSVEAIECIVSMIEYSKKLGLKIILKDSMLCQVPKTFSPSNIVESNNHISICLHK